MKSWTAPPVPSLPGRGVIPRLFDTSSQTLVEATPTDGIASVYVCGITPYDATHIGHAATYLTYDLLQRVWRDAGVETRYAQNITDVDDPLLERATATGADWRDLAAEQISLFRTDMAALGVIPPEYFIGVTESINRIALGVADLLSAGLAYRVPTHGSEGDIYFDTDAAGRKTPWQVGSTTPYEFVQLAEFSRERGGDPDRAGKRNPLDPLLWRTQRDNEPSWESPVGAGRPGWHIECTVIAVDALGSNITVQGGGSDLIFPHHDFSAGHAIALHHKPLARIFNHAGLVAYEGEKMSKSRGNLVFVSALRSAGIDPAIIRLAIAAHHYRTAWEWTDATLTSAADRWATWRASFVDQPSPQKEGAMSSLEVLAQVRKALAHDLNTPVALATIDQAAHTGVDDPALLEAAILSLLGISLVPAAAATRLAVSAESAV
ncbi:cysteine--1-D-myo-inosityl 2-amino-2-deoxy-alpha-D-glucopyranoside ligase [Klugiella xanthotipulae]|uniref:L-cysteine:1D-myo-inositol 2-amino-2-deoxy-alpha-D-glucopyranoside ligase n=1 Tax=Klugiella xanthotipulae TaxID=244735 RepID=A0A543HT24_9MICO|nr:cysteine--1-D-myo-inosityl 2-amino-2-deoxy-alpha-D-glucopyranoside ligase [Klugiella xanthotipulae]TQM61409.1 L-cysteine:1D-myo-inositol 2-amino-2-deoxy-alpha-D-glucopyranoside ligase [Klugiella xanthotipulae]